MTKFLIRKVLFMIPMLLVISALIFFALELTPADPINYIIPPDVALNSESVEALRELYGLNDPVYVRYFRWLFNLVRGDFGYSITYGTSINLMIQRSLPATLELSAIVILISTIIGIGLGLISAIKQNGVIDYVGRIFGVVGVSIPQFLFGIAAIQVFAIYLGWFPIGGRVIPGQIQLLDRLEFLFLPVLTMVIAMTAALLRYTRNSMLDVLNKDYIKLARSKGIPEWKVYIKHALRTSLRPVLVVLIFRLPILIGGSIVIEAVFSWPGIGSVILSSISSGDYPVVMVTTLMVAASILVASLIIDLVTALLDPRVRFE
jgi:peptide/nickel transport system permease protein